MTSPVEFPYRPKIGKLLFGILFFGVSAFSLWHAALTNDRGLIINGIIHFDIHGATVFYSIMAALSVLFVVFALTAIISSLTSSGRLRLTDTGVHFPHGIFQRTCKIPFSAILHLRLIQARGHRFLEIQCADRKISIIRGWLPDGAFEQVCRIVAERTNAGQVRTGPSQRVLSQQKSFGRRR